VESIFYAERSGLTETILPITLFLYGDFTPPLLCNSHSNTNGITNSYTFSATPARDFMRQQPRQKKGKGVLLSAKIAKLKFGQYREFARGSSNCTTLA
jgi:hypothetical protein